MKKIRIFALGSILVLGFAVGALAQQTETTTDSDQPAAQSQPDDKAAPSTDQQTAPEPEQQTTPTPDNNSTSSDDAQQ